MYVTEVFALIIEITGRTKQEVCDALRQVKGNLILCNNVSVNKSVKHDRISDCLFSSSCVAGKVETAFHKIYVIGKFVNRLGLIGVSRPEGSYFAFNNQ